MVPTYLVKSTLTASESRACDVDLTEEMVNFTRQQVMVQAGTAMLAQASAIPNSVLALTQ